MGCSKSVVEKNQNTEKSKKRVVQSNNTDIRKNYEFISYLGNGAFGKVRLYRDKFYKDLLFAIKTLKKVDIPAFQFSLLKSEVKILSNLDHPNIVKYFGTFEDNYYIHIVMEYLKGHDLYKIISIKNYTGFDEKDMCEIIQQLLKALSFIHSKGIVHRDIKPENILFSSKLDYSSLKLIDFGLATKNVDNKKVGTPYYMSPEMIKGQSCPKSDIWSVGVILHLMLTGKYPFTDERDEQNRKLFDIIVNDSLDTKYLEENECSEESIDFVKRCLQKDVEKRPDSEECLKHAWIQKFSVKNNKHTINEDTINTLLDFANKTALQKEIYFFLAKISNENDLVKLKHFFNQLDVNNKGTLTKTEIEDGFKQIGIKIDDEDLSQIWEGLDFHKDGEVNYSEFLAAMVSSYNFEKEEKLWSVFNLFKESNNKDQDFITYSSLYNSIKSLNLQINEKELKNCFNTYKKEIKFEDFKKLILESELEDKNNSSRFEFSRTTDKVHNTLIIKRKDRINTVKRSIKE